MPRSKDVPTLEKEIRELKREVSRLQKLLEQDFPVKEEQMLAEVDRLAAIPKETIEKVDLCPYCRSELRTHKTPMGSLVTGCPACKKYKKIKRNQ
jgi:uncharacterized protein with PIN domain